MNIMKVSILICDLLIPFELYKYQSSVGYRNGYGDIPLDIIRPLAQTCIFQ